MQDARAVEAFPPGHLGEESSGVLGQPDVGTGVDRGEGVGPDEHVEHAAQICLPVVGVRHHDHPGARSCRAAQDVDEGMIDTQVLDVHIDLRLTEDLRGMLVESECGSHRSAHRLQGRLPLGTFHGHRTIRDVVHRPAQLR